MSPIGDTRHCWNCWRTSCAGCDDEAVYTMGRYNEGRYGTMCRAEGLEQAQGRGIVSAPQRDDAIHSWDEGVYGRMSTIQSPLDPFSPFPGSTNLHDYLLLYPPSLCFGERTSQWKLDPGFFPFCRTNEHRMPRYRSCGDILVKWD